MFYLSNEYVYLCHLSTVSVVCCISGSLWNTFWVRRNKSLSFWLWNARKYLSIKNNNVRLMRKSSNYSILQ